MSRDINKLKEPFRTQIKKLIARANDAGIPAFVTDTTRTLAEQKELVKKGYSKTLKSKHLVGEAADIAFKVNGRLSYKQGMYERMYLIVKELSFVIWPYRDLGWKWDKPHFQYDKNKIVVKKDDTIQVMENKRVGELTEQVRRLHKEVRSLTKEVHKYKGNYERVQEAYNQKDADFMESEGQASRWEENYKKCINKQFDKKGFLERVKEILYGKQ